MTTGEGGMVVTNDPAIEEICRSLREFGRADQRNIANDRYYSDDRLHDYDRRYVFNRIGYNLRMTDIVGAFGVEQLQKLDSMNAQRRENAAMLRSLLAPIGDVIGVPAEQPGYVHTYYTFPMVLGRDLPFSRREFCEYLEAKGIETRPLFAGCLPDQPAFRSAPGRIVGDLSNSRFLRDRAMFVGIHPGLTKSHIQHVAESVVSFVRAHRASSARSRG
jgi:CDP-6-deoxy-D-xylo-4-hexulose-3-dehydrase